MRRKQNSTDSKQAAKNTVKRREALKGLSAVAASAPILGVLGCGSDGNGGGAAGGSPGNGTGGSVSSSGGASSGGMMSNNSGGSVSYGGSTTSGGSTQMMSSGGSSQGGSTTAGASGQGTSGGGAGPGGAGGAAAGGPGKGGAGGTAAGGTASGGSGGVSGGAGGSGGTGMVPPWDDVPMCSTVSKTDGAGQGPFFIHDKEVADDISLFRSDIRGQLNASAAKGVDMNLHLRIIDKKSMECGKPVVVPNLDVYIWHTDAQGFYSGFGKDGEQKPDEPYAGKPGQGDIDTGSMKTRFCRGFQTTNADGVVSFLSTFPGWYNGRDLHIHVVVFKQGSTSKGRVAYCKPMGGGCSTGFEAEWVFTTQFYFQPEFSKMIHENNEPYKARTKIAAYEGAMKADENGNSGLRAKATLSADNVVTAQMQLVVDAS